jgi:hypothetical protein
MNRRGSAQKVPPEADFLAPVFSTQGIRPDSTDKPYLSIEMAQFSPSAVTIFPAMTFPVRELLQVMLGLCVGLAVVVLMRDLIARGRKLPSKPTPADRIKIPSTAAPKLTDLESELE